jgi:hypothetical protein
MITIQEDRKLRALFLFGLCALLVAFTQELADGRIELGNRLLKRPSDFLESIPRLDLDMFDRDRSRRNGRLSHANLQQKLYCTSSYVKLTSLMPIETMSMSRIGWRPAPRV